MKKVVSIGLVVLLAVIGIAGCFGNGEEHATDNGNIEEHLPVSTQEAIAALEELEIWGGFSVPTDYSQFVGDWYDYYAAVTSMLRISEIDESEITFILVRYHNEGGPAIIGPYTLPIVDSRVRFEENDIRGEGDWTKLNHIFVFSGDEIRFAIEGSSSGVLPDGTVNADNWTIGIHNDKIYREFRLLSASPMSDSGWIQQTLDEELNSR